jgi:hypothetical protein
MGAHASTRTTQLYDTGAMTLDEVVKFNIRGVSNSDW